MYLTNQLGGTRCWPQQYWWHRCLYNKWLALITFKLDQEIFEHAIRMFLPWEILSSPKKILKLRLLFPKENIGEGSFSQSRDPPQRTNEKKAMRGVTAVTKHNNKHKECLKNIIYILLFPIFFTYSKNKFIF